jgi:kynurenine formamidase
VLPDSYAIGPKELGEALRRQGTEIRPGDIVMVRTGRMRYWPDPATYLPREPGLDREGAVYLAETGVSMIGCDNIAVEQLPSEDPDNWMTVHTYLLAEAGVPMAEVVYLEELASEAIYEFVFIGASLRMRGATAGPIRPLALPLL